MEPIPAPAKPFVERIRLRNFLSFGANTPDFELRNLNVLIGGNATGKTNLIEAFQLLQALPNDLGKPIAEGGGAASWVRQQVAAERDSARSKSGSFASIDVQVHLHDYESAAGTPLHYHLSFGEAGDNRLSVRDEYLKDATPNDGDSKQANFYFEREGDGRYKVPGNGNGSYRPGSSRTIEREQHLEQQSFLCHAQALFDYPTVSKLASWFEQIALYRDWTLGRFSNLRGYQSADLSGDRLLDDLSNLYAVLVNRTKSSDLQETLVSEMKNCLNLTSYSVLPQSDGLELRFRENGAEISAAHLSDGSLRYLALLVILCDPHPPPLICIEEPELGIHMDAIPRLVELLQNAARRTQLVVTTHSAGIIDGLSDVPEAVVVCGKSHDGTVLQRLDREEIMRYVDDDDRTKGLGWMWEEGYLGGLR